MTQTVEPNSLVWVDEVDRKRGRSPIRRTGGRRDERSATPVRGRSGSAGGTGRESQASPHRRPPRGGHRRASLTPAADRERNAPPAPHPRPHGRATGQQGWPSQWTVRQVVEAPPANQARGSVGQASRERDQSERQASERAPTPPAESPAPWRQGLAPKRKGRAKGKGKEKGHRKKGEKGKGEKGHGRTRPGTGTRGKGNKGQDRGASRDP